MLTEIECSIRAFDACLAPLSRWGAVERSVVRVEGGCRDEPSTAAGRQRNVSADRGTLRRRTGVFVNWIYRKAESLVGMVSGNRLGSLPLAAAAARCLESAARGQMTQSALTAAATGAIAESQMMDDPTDSVDHGGQF